MFVSSFFLGGGEINSLFERRGMKETWKHVWFNGCLIYVLIYCTKAYLGFSVQANILDEIFEHFSATVLDVSSK